MRAHIKKVGQNVGFLTIAAGVRGSAIIIVQAYLGRLLGPKAFGVFALSFAFTTISFRLTDLGLDIITVREVARNKNLAVQYARNMLALRLLVVMLVTLLSFLIASFLYTSQVRMVIFLLSLHWGLVYLSYVLFSIFRAYEQMQYEALTFLLASLLTIGGGIYAAQVTQSVVNVATIFALAGAVQLGLPLLIFAYKFGWPRPTYHRRLWKYVLSEGMPLGVAIIFLIVYTRVDTVLLSLLRNEEQVGWYSAAYTLITASGLASTAILSAMFPRFSTLYQQNRAQLRQLYLVVLGSLTLFGLMVGLLGTLFAKQIITLVYGPGYESSVLVFRILVWAVVFLYTNNLCGVTLNATDKTRVTMKVVGIAAAFNIILNLALIPGLGMVAASIATVSTEFLVLLISLIYLESFFKKEKVRIKAGKEEGEINLVETNILIPRGEESKIS